MEDGARDRALEPVFQPALAQVDVLQIPGVADRRMRVGHVHLIGTGDYPLGDGRRRTDHQIIPRHVELLHGDRHERQVGSVTLSREGQSLDEAGRDRLALQELAVFERQKVDDAEQVGLWI